MRVPSLARIDEGQDVRVLKVCGDADFAQKALATQDDGELGMQHLEGDRAVVLDEIRTFLATNPQTAGRDDLAIPYRVDAYWCERR